MAGWLGCYYVWYLPKARRESRKAGLKAVVLLPLYPWYARGLLYLTELCLKTLRLDGCWIEAYEVHIENITKDRYYKTLKTDLKLMMQKKKTLYIWETSAPIPAEFRKLFAQLKNEGRAFWVKGRWPIPRVPGTSLGIKDKYARIGAVIWEGDAE